MVGSADLNLQGNGNVYNINGQEVRLTGSLQKGEQEGTYIYNGEVVTDEDLLQIANQDEQDYDAIMAQVNQVAADAENVATDENASDSDISNVFSKMKQLKANIATFTSQLEILDKQIADKQSELEQRIQDLEKLQEEEAEIKKNIQEQQDKLEVKNEEIDKVNKLIKAQQAILDGEDLSTEDGAQAYSDAAGKISSLYEKLGGLQDDKSSIVGKLGDLNGQLEAKQSEISRAQMKVDSLNQVVSNLQTQRTSISTQKAAAEEELSKIKIDIVSEEELALVEANNVDLYEKMENGEPRYIFAKGKSDGKYHIYDMQQGATLARLYADGQGFDIVESGNGYISGFNKTGEGEGETCFYLEECGGFGEFNACYCTSSPLSLDINGDGVKTSTDVVDFDIDGDGKVDKINDSADAVLVFDKDGDGISGADGSECFGDNTDLDGDGVKDGFSDGFAALKAFAADKGLINGVDDNVLDENDIKFLEENYGFKVKAGGYNSEAQSLLDLGITEINLAQTDETTLDDNFDGNGNQLMHQQGATFKINGETREYADIWHKKLDESIENAKDVFGGHSVNLDMSASSNFALNHVKANTSAESYEAFQEITETKQDEQRMKNLLKELFKK